MMNLPKRSFTHNGFALVVTLSLMILLTIIAVGLLSLSTISLRSATQGDAMSTARANARLALMLALGELQNHAGSDTRVTASADILNKNNPRILGVWKSWEGADHEQSGAFAGRPKSPGNYQAEKKQRFLRWLVSGIPNQLTNSDNLPPTESSATRVPLIGKNTVGDNQTHLQIHLDPVFTNDRKGSYAWWVGGENQKARLPDPYDTGGATQADLAGIMKSHSIADPKTFGMESLLSDPSQVAKAISLKQTDLIPQTGTVKASRNHFFDLSTVSTGLLTNTATGGWRKDLSLFAENFDSLPTSNLSLFRITPDKDAQASLTTSASVRAPGSMLYPWASYLGGPSDKPSRQQGASASWANLKDYALTYRKFTNTTPFGLRATSLTTAKDPYTYLHTTRQLPVVARVQWVFSHYGRMGSNGRDYTPAILVNPVFTLWNPYNVALRNIGSMYFTVGDEINPSPLPVSFKYEVTDGVPEHRSTGYKSLTMGSLNYTDPALAATAKVLQYSIPSVPDLAPGATMVFSASSQHLPSHAREMAPGYRPKNGHLFILTATNTPTNWCYTPDGNAKIRLWVKFDNKFMANGKEATGVRLVVRQDANKAGSDAAEIEYRMLVDPANAKPYPELQDIAESKPLSQIRDTYDPFFSLNAGIRIASNLYSPIQEYVPAKGLAQTTPFSGYTATGDMDEAEPTIASNYPGTGNQVNSPLDFSFVKHTALGDMTPNVAADNSGYIVTGFTAGDGLRRCIAADLPTQPLASLAELQHWDMRFGNPIPPFSFNIIGNSDASPLLPSDSTVNSSHASIPGNLQHDDSYCANHLLFDDWFVSSIAAGLGSGRFGGSTSASGSTTLLRRNYTDFLNGSSPLTNRSYKPLHEDRVRAAKSTSEINQMFSEHVQNNDSWQTIASRLEVEGMFNVNSTSVAAWRALLGHARDQQIPYYRAGGSVALSSKTNHVISRSSIAGDTEAGSLGASGDFSAASQFTGYRKLDDNLLDELAGKIVEQVRLRGPFLSFSEFINRQLSTNKNLALAGAVQSALNELEKSSNLYSGIGSAFNSANPTSPANPGPGAGYQFAEAAVGSNLYGLPGWPRQADVIRPLAPILSARDDTFTIRAYGDARDASNKITANATCEAVVRRTRGFTDPKDDASLASPPTSPVNKAFGRRFEIISFRWLSPNEI